MHSNLNPHLVSLGVLLLIICLFFAAIMFYKKFMDNGKKTVNINGVNTQQRTQSQDSNKSDDEFHVGGITTEQFILLLMKHRSFDYAGYSFDSLYNKKTQTGYNAFDLYDGLWKLFGSFDEILSLDYVDRGYGSYYQNGVDVTYREERDEMAIRVNGMYMVGSLSEMMAFRNDPLQNYYILDLTAASRNPSDYIGYIK